MGRAGAPTTVLPAGTSLNTALPIPTVTSSPNATNCFTVAPAPTQTFCPALTPPASTAFGLRWEKSPTSQSCSTTAPVFTIQPAPRVAQALITALRSEEHTSELQSRPHLVCRLLLEKKK